MAPDSQIQLVYTAYLVTYAKVRGDVCVPASAITPIQVPWSAISAAIATNDAKNGDAPRSATDLHALIERMS